MSVFPGGCSFAAWGSRGPVAGVRSLTILLLVFDSGLSSYAPKTKGTDESESAQEVPLVNWKDLSPGVPNNELESPNSLRDNGWKDFAGVMDSRG